MYSNLLQREFKIVGDVYSVVGLSAFIHVKIRPPTPFASIALRGGV
jgi:hypothetical protein